MRPALCPALVVLAVLFHSPQAFAQTEPSSVAGDAARTARQLPPSPAADTVAEPGAPAPEPALLVVSTPDGPHDLSVGAFTCKSDVGLPCAFRLPPGKLSLRMSPEHWSLHGPFDLPRDGLFLETPPSNSAAMNLTLLGAGLLGGFALWHGFRDGTRGIERSVAQGVSFPLLCVFYIGVASERFARAQPLPQRPAYTAPGAGSRAPVVMLWRLDAGAELQALGQPMQFSAGTEQQTIEVKSYEVARLDLPPGPVRVETKPDLDQAFTLPREGALVRARSGGRVFSQGLGGLLSAGLAVPALAWGASADDAAAVILGRGLGGILLVVGVGTVIHAIAESLRAEPLQVEPLREAR